VIGTTSGPFEGGFREEDFPSGEGVGFENGAKDSFSCGNRSKGFPFFQAYYFGPRGERNLGCHAMVYEAANNQILKWESGAVIKRLWAGSERGQKYQREFHGYLYPGVDL